MLDCNLDVGVHVCAPSMHAGEMQGPDEVKEFLDGRFVSSAEAMWHTLSFPMHGGAPNVIRLAVHLHDCQRVQFNHNDALAELAELPAPVTKLTDFFALCARDPNARAFTYPDIAQHYAWDASLRRWKRRRNDRSRRL